MLGRDRPDQAKFLIFSRMKIWGNRLYTEYYEPHREKSMVCQGKKRLEKIRKQLEGECSFDGIGERGRAKRLNRKR
jgi:hypothetical protein